MAVGFALFAILATAVAGFALVRLRALRAELGRRDASLAAAARLARYCPQTGLANRRRAIDWLSAASPDERAGSAIAIALDPHRHGAAEQACLAQSVAERLVRVAGERGLAARLGPAEYLLALSGDCETTGLIARAQAIHDALAPLLGDQPGLRMGAAQATPTDLPEDVIAKAQAAISLAGIDGGASIGVQGLELEQGLRTRAAESKALAAAIVEGRIEPFFQPLVDLGSGKVLGFEVLARWRDEEGRVRLPGEFLPLAEETGLVGEMFFALLRRAAADVRRWPSEWSFTLNLSPLQFSDRWLVERTVQTLLKAGIAPGRLEIELSERALEHDLEGARLVIEALRCHGVRVALDNFGSGNLPLRELAQLNFDRLKVDGRMLGSDKDRRATFGVIAAAAHHLGMPVVVQGIETRDGAEQAQLQGAAIGQGFLFGRPDPQTEYFRLEGALARRGPDDAAA